MILHLAGGGVLGDKAKEGEHGKAPVLQLLELVLFQGLCSKYALTSVPPLHSQSETQINIKNQSASTSQQARHADGC